MEFFISYKNIEARIHYSVRGPRSRLI